MQAATYHSQPLATKQVSGDSVRASVSHLLTKAYALPCSTAAQAFAQLVQPTSRFQLALDVLLPLLDAHTDSAQRILVSYILYSLYAPHPIAINPFQSVLASVFTKERDYAVAQAKEGNTAENEQLVWVLWKILKGDGNDIGPFSPNTLAHSPLPPKLRASHLTLDDDAPTPDRKRFDPFRESESPSDGASPNMSSSDQDEIAIERDQEYQKLSEAMNLLLAARNRVLTLSEQRILSPLIPQLTSPPMITSVDLPFIISNNPILAHPLLVGLLTYSSSSVSDPEDQEQTQAHYLYLEVLKHLPPTLPSFDLLGRLLRDATTVPDFTTGGRTTIADLVRTEVLGWFIHESIAWLDNAEQEERDGNISDDRFAKGVQNLCRFYNSLIKLAIVDPASDADTAEMAHFTLRNLRFNEAHALYGVLAMPGF